jgi:hypothetical protein
VGQPEYTLSDVGSSDDDGPPLILTFTHKPSFAVRARARSAKIDGCCGISQVLQVQTYSGEPFTPCKLAASLLANKDCRFADADKALKNWPEVPIVFDSKLFSCNRKGLTR